LYCNLINEILTIDSYTILILFVADPDARVTACFYEACLNPQLPRNSIKIPRRVYSRPCACCPVEGIHVHVARRVSVFPSRTIVKLRTLAAPFVRSPNHRGKVAIQKPLLLFSGILAQARIQFAYACIRTTRQSSFGPARENRAGGSDRAGTLQG
jgi:hypothetical protein